MSGLTGFNVVYSNTFGGDKSYVDISYIFNPRTSSTNVPNTNMFYKQSGINYTDISNVFLKSSTNGVTGISYEVITVTNFYDPSSNSYDIGEVFQPYYNDISFSTITSSVSSGLHIYKYINGVKFTNTGNSNYTGRFKFLTPSGNTSGKFTINFACVGGGGGSSNAGGGGGAIIIGSADMSYNFLYYFGVGNGLKGTGGNTFFRATQTSNDMSYNFITNGGVQGGGSNSPGNGGTGGSVQINIRSGILNTINYISSGGGGGGGYDTSGSYYGAGGLAGSYNTTSGSGTVSVTYGGPGQAGKGVTLFIDSSNCLGGNGGGNYDPSGAYTVFNSIPDQATNYFGGGGGGNSFVPNPGPSYDGFPSNYPTNTWIQGGSGATTSSGSSSINTTQYGGGAGASRVHGTTGSAGSGYLLFWWNYPLT
jgi:hypothetical protein